MLSRRYLQSHLRAFIVTFTLALCCATSVLANETSVIFPSTSQNETDSSGTFSQGSDTGTTTSNEVDSSTESPATPALSTSLFPFAAATTDLPPSSAEKSTVTILPSSSALPSMIITATKVTLGHRMLSPETSTESNEGFTETPPTFDEELSTDLPPNSGEGSREKVSSGATTTSDNVSEVAPQLLGAQSNRQARYHRYHDNYAVASEHEEHQAEHDSYRGNDFHETSTEYYREAEVEGGDSYVDFGEDNELTEHLPTPMALINPNGEGNNPPLEDDFAEAFKKVNSNGKRRRFRGGRRGRMKLKKLNDTNDSNVSSSTVNEQEENKSKSSASEWSLHSTTPSPSSSPTKFKRYRSTTPNSFFERTSTTSIPSRVSVETGSDDGGNGPVVKNGPKPMILQSMSYDETNDVTPVPQIEKPGNGGHTEKISTYFFSTPSPSARLRLRQKIRESLPSTSPSTTSTTTTTTEAPTESTIVDFPSENEAWKNDFADFPNPFFSEPPKRKFKIPEFVPINIGLESDDRQEPVENSLSRPDQVEDKSYHVGHQHYNSESPSTHGSYDTSYSESSTTPKSHKMRRPSSESFTKHRDYDSKPHVSPTASEAEKPMGTEYYDQGSNTESSTTFSSASHRPTTGSHYDRTKDKVIFFNDSPYSTQHTSTAGLAEMTQAVSETTPGTSSQTVGGHFSVSEGPSFYEGPPLSSMVTVDHHYPPVSENNQMGMFTRGQVYPAEDGVPQIESTFKNGPPDSTHIHSPNIVEHAQPQPSPSDVPSDSENLQHLQHHSHHSNHQDSYPQTFMENSHHQSMSRPGGDAIYGTVEEVPAHLNPSFEHLNPFHHHHHNMPPHPPPGSMHFPFGSEHPRSHPLHAPAMPYPPPPHSYPVPPPPPSHHGEHNLPSHPVPPPPLPPPPSNLYNHHHHHADIHNHNSFAPPYESHSTDNFPNNNQLDSHLNSNNIADSPSEMSHGMPSIHTPSNVELIQQVDGHQSGTSSSPTSASPPDFPPSLISNNAPESAADPQAAYNNGPPPPPPHMDHNFPPHSHTMAAHPDYEPANPPLPHDHPFHNTFIPFPHQDFPPQPHEQSEHQGHDSNSIAAGGSGSSYQPGIVESVPTGRPNSFEPSPLIPAKFTPLPDDVLKETDLYNSFATKPHETSPPHEHSGDTSPEGSLPSNHIPDIHQNTQHHHPNNPMNSYLGTIGDDHSSFNNHPHSPSIGPSGSDHGNPDVNGYAGPVHEIHSGTYHPPNNIDEAINDPGDSYRPHHSYGSHDYDHSTKGAEFNIHEGDSDYKHVELGGHHDKPHHEEHEGDSHHHGPHDMSSGILGGSDGKKEKKRQQAAFSNTPYVLMFPQLIPEEKMRPSPPSLLSKEIPVIQASSMADFTSGEKPPLGPGFQAVPVHPRHQMYQVLAKTHYEKMMERYKESKKKPPSAIYTPYGILVPVGTNVDAAASMNHNVFAKPRLPPKYRGEKSLLNALLGSPSSNHGRFHPPMMSSRLTKMFEYEPAIDMLADKLAMKIVSAQHVLSQKKSGQSEISEKSDGKTEESTDKTKDKEDHLAMESKIRATIANPELKDYLKDVLKGHLTEMVETSVSVEDRRPITLSSKLLNSFFRKGRIGMNQPPPPPPLKGPSPMMMQSSASMLMPNKVPPPPGLQTQPSSYLHSGIGHPFPPPLPQGPGGLLGTIRRLFSFAPPESRYDVGVAPNFGGRTLYSSNGTRLPYIDGPSPRSSHFQPQIILPHPNMIHQYPPLQHMQARISNGPVPPPTSLLTASSNKSVKSSGSISSPTTPKPSKKKRKPTTSTIPKKPTLAEENKWQSNNRLTSSFTPSVKISDSPQIKNTTAAQAKPMIINNKSSSNYYRNNSGNGTNNNNSSSTFNKQQVVNRKTGTSSSSATSYMTDKSNSKVKSESHYDSSSKKTEIVLNKRTGIPSSSSSPSSSSPSSSTADAKDIFQTILGSTRSVLNYFKSTEARSAGSPTVLEPRSATTSTFVVESNSTRKRRSLVAVT